MLCISSFGQEIQSMFPVTQGIQLNYSFRAEDGSVKALNSLIVRKVSGNLKNGEISLVLKCQDAKGRDFFSKPNEFRMTVTKENGKTTTEMDQVAKLIKVQEMLPFGDASVLPVQMKVGDRLPDSQINVKIAGIKATVNISDKKVLDHKIITTKAGSFDCYLVHEKAVTKTSFGTTEQWADSWYSVGKGAVKLTIHEKDGTVVGTQELISISYE